MILRALKSHLTMHTMLHKHWKL